MVILLGISMMTAKEKVVTWAGSDISCLPNGHKNLAMHIHSKLTIVVDGVPELIPTSIGDTKDCMAEVHTHDASGAIHAEGIVFKEITLKDFFAVWGKNIEREGYTLSASVAGVLVENPADIVIEDGKDIVYTYTKIVKTDASE